MSDAMAQRAMAGREVISFFNEVPDAIVRR
jgi:hypothetical protein